MCYQRGLGGPPSRRHTFFGRGVINPPRGGITTLCVLNKRGFFSREKRIKRRLNTKKCVGMRGVCAPPAQNIICARAAERGTVSWTTPGRTPIPARCRRKKFLLGGTTNTARGIIVFPPPPGERRSARCFLSKKKKERGAGATWLARERPRRLCGVVLYSRGGRESI